MKKWNANGIDVCYNFDKRRAYGWSYDVKEGDLLRVPMQNGKTALLKFVNFKRCDDPADMYFADLEDVGYEEESLKAELGKEGV